MTFEASLSVLAIDGGGTRCRIALDDGREIVSVETGSANVSTDFAGGVREITEGLAGLAERLGRSEADLSGLPAHVGLAGVTGPEIAQRLRAALPFRHVRITDDRPTALRGVLGRRDGVIAHCGTGSFYGAQSGSGMRLAGGWGLILGDEASAAWIGRLALGVTLEAEDGRQSPSPLSARLMEDMGGTAGIVRFAGTARPADFGRLAPLVTDLAGRDDPLATHVMEKGAVEIIRALHRIGWTPGQAICLTGGIGPLYADYLPDEMRACLAAPEGSPLDGALSLARDLAREIADDRG